MGWKPYQAIVLKSLAIESSVYTATRLTLTLTLYATSTSGPWALCLAPLSMFGALASLAWKDQDGRLPTQGFELRP